MAVQLLGASLFGLGDAGSADPIDGFLTTSPSPSSTDVANFLKAFAPSQRNEMAQKLIGRGVSASTISAALKWLDASEKLRGNWPTIAGILSVASAAASGYHGYRRNQSIGWAVWWFFMGSIFPVVTPAIALAQGFGKKKG